MFVKGSAFEGVDVRDRGEEERGRSVRGNVGGVQKGCGAQGRVACQPAYWK